MPTELYDVKYDRPDIQPHDPNSLENTRNTVVRHIHDSQSEHLVSSVHPSN